MKARIRHDLSANPVQNAEARYFMAMRTREAMQPKNKTRLINDDTSIVGAGFVHAGTANANATFGGFIVCQGNLSATVSANTIPSARTRRLHRKHKHKRQHVFQRTSFWIYCSSVSSVTSTGL